ncbi:OHS family lactose permease-like MFS transporter [Paenibacillus brasilensis]|uniref:OHS family lactose permease-like MFS transporter n=1 Tax=Paenibacillus brasilensis TaxID=128574 RepID=A0ABU0KYL2_9BACL|nr:OHS family lactose permease-like MFS transporter [Paenibacillus brasilensis]
MSLAKRNYWSLSIFNFAYLFTWSAAMSFFVIWLGQSLGISETYTGFLYAANSIVALVMQPLFGYLSDKLGLRKHLLYMLFTILLLVGPFFIYVYGPLLQTQFVIGAIVGALFIGLVFNAGNGVVDSYMDKVSRKYGFEYGRVRMWGSLGWAAATFVAGRVININVNLTFWIASVSAVVAMICIFLTKVEISGQEQQKTESLKLIDVLHLVRTTKFWFLMLFMVGVTQIYEVYDQQFATYFVSQFSSKAEGNQFLGDLSAVQVFLEFVFLLVTPWFVNKTTAKWALIIAGAIMSLRIIGSSLPFGSIWVAGMKMIHSLEKPLILVAISLTLISACPPPCTCCICLWAPWWFPFSRQLSDICMKS